MRSNAMLSILGLYGYDQTLFDNMELPESIDRDTLVNNLLAELSELEILYTDADFMKSAISIWSKKEIKIWKRVETAVNTEYNPLDNYNRHEEYSDQNTGTASADSKNTTAGYNSADMVQNAGAENSGKSENTSTGNHHMYGNIGVTTSQQMLREELDIAKETNLYDYIINDFKNRFCILVY